MPEELWMKVCNIIQEVVTKIMPPKRNARKQSGCLMGGLQITRKESERQRRKGKIYTSKCRVPEKRKKRQETLLEWTMQRNRGKQ